MPDREHTPDQPERTPVPPGFPAEEPPEFPVRPEPPGFPTEDPPQPSRVPPEISPPAWEPGPALPSGPDVPPANPSWINSEMMAETQRENPTTEL